MSAAEPTISIQIPWQGEPTLADVLSSILRETYPRFEVIVADGSGRPDARPKVDSAKVTFVDIPNDFGLLAARETANRYSRGDFALLLDCTRPILPGCLSELARASADYDYVIIPERSTGRGFWAHAASVDKIVAMSEENIRLSLSGGGFVIPRLFRRRFLTGAFAELRIGLGGDFNFVVHGDHFLVFEAAKRQGGKVGVAEHDLIKHYEDTRLLQIIRKYSRYGYSNVAFINLRGYPSPSNPVARIRRARDIGYAEFTELVILYVVRAWCFYGGYGLSILAHAPCLVTRRTHRAAHGFRE